MDNDLRSRHKNNNMYLRARLTTMAAGGSKRLVRTCQFLRRQRPVRLVSTINTAKKALQRSQNSCVSMVYSTVKVTVGCWRDGEVSHTAGFTSS